MAMEESLTGMKKIIFEPTLPKESGWKSNSLNKKDCLSDFRNFLNGPHPMAFQETRHSELGVQSLALSPQEKASLSGKPDSNFSFGRITQPLRLRSLEVDMEENKNIERPRNKTDFNKEGIDTKIVFIQKRVEDLDSTESEKQKSYDGIMMEEARSVNTEMEAFDYNDADVLVRLRMQSIQEFNQDIFQEVMTELGDSMIFNPSRKISNEQKGQARKSNFSNLNVSAEKPYKLNSPNE